MFSVDDVSLRLQMLGYDFGSDELDATQVNYETDKIITYVMNYCGFATSSEIPDILEKRIIDRICADFLAYKKNSGTLANFNYDTCIKEIKEGDTTLKYVNGQGEDTPESRFDAMTKALERGFDKWLTPHRRLRW